MVVPALLLPSLLLLLQAAAAGQAPFPARAPQGHAAWLAAQQMPQLAQLPQP
jgi:hypothetical protein